MQVQNIRDSLDAHEETVSVWDHEVDFSWSERRETVKVVASRGTILELLGDVHFPLQDGVRFHPMGAENGFSPFLFKRGYRRIENAKTASMLVLDYDELTEPQEKALFAALDAICFAYVAHTTGSHLQYQAKKDAKFCCWRVVLPLDGPASAADYGATLKDLLARLPADCKADPMVSVVNQRWMLPRARALSIARGQAKFVHRDGRLLRVVKAPILSLVAPLPAPLCTLEEVKAKLTHLHSPNVEVRAATEAILIGAALPFEQGRRQIRWLRVLTSIIRITGCAADQLLELVTPSVSVGLREGHSVTLRSVGYQIRRAIETVRATPSTFVPKEKKMKTVTGALVKARVLQFMGERLTPSSEARTSGRDLYNAFLVWTEGKGSACSNHLFGKVLKQAGIKGVHTRNGTQYRFITN